MASRNALAATLVVVIVVVLSPANPVTGQNAENHSETLIVRRQKCVMEKTCSRDWSNMLRWKCDNQDESCAYVDVSEARTTRRCKSGWTGDFCHIALCDPPCQGGRVCRRPSMTCECLHESCTYNACSSSRDCYPGTCVHPYGECRCFPGFSGTNCQTVEIAPRISECSVQIYADSQLVSTSECYPENIPAVTRLLLTRSPTRIVVRWRTEFNWQTPGLPSVQYVSQTPISVGIVDTHCIVNTRRIRSAMKYCVKEAYSRPQLSKDCVVDVAWSDLAIQTPLDDGTEFNISIVAKTGAEKTGNRQHPNGLFTAKRIMANKAVRLYTSFQVDVNPPTHCLLNGADDQQCPCFPILLEQDITTDAVIEPLICGWSDIGSGISRFHVKVYSMQPGGDGTLQETGEALHSEDIIPPYLSFRYTCVQSGVYSIHLTVFDRTNNSARARKLLNYDGGSKWTVNETVKVRIANANPSTDYTWINNLPAPQNGFYRLTLTWAGRYKTNAKHDEAWLKAAKPWTGCTASSNCIDDIYRGRFGLRTIDKVVNISSSLNYTVVYQTDSNGGLGLIDEPMQNTTSITAEQTVLLIPVAELHDGRSIIVWFAAQDMSGNADRNRLVLHYDQSKPKATGVKLVAETDDEFMSRLCINVTDRQSGIKEIRYTIYNKKLQQTIHAATEPPVRFVMEHEKDRGPDNQVTDKECPRNGDESCYCIPSGDCFAIVQCVDIDNCKFDYYNKDPLEFNYVTTNQAGLNATGTFKPSAALLRTVRCSPSATSSICEVASQTDMSSVYGVASQTAIVILGLVVIILTAFIVWRYVKSKDPVLPNNQTDPNAHVDAGEDNRQNYAVNAAYQSAAYRKDDAGNEYSVSLQKNANVAECQQVQSTDTDYGAVALVSPMTVNARQVVTEKTLAEGNFAVVKSGKLTLNNECVPIAVKMLRRSFPSEDMTLMELKINFLRSISYHANIVKFIASYDGGIEGPAMLLELCDMTMKDWLTKNAVTVDTLEEILGFVMDIARGVEHLHSRHIVHRRLAVRNVLLKFQTSGLVAKLIGFGPCDEDIQGGAKDDVSRPLRWLAPETLNTLKSKNPMYNNKTDSWCFGITVWELYSKGEKPYPGFEVHEVKGLLERGYQMACPKDCPHDLFKSVVVSCWDAVPMNRPEFSDIMSKIAKFRGNDRKDV